MQNSEIQHRMRRVRRYVPHDRWTAKLSLVIELLGAALFIYSVLQILTWFAR